MNPVSQKCKVLVVVVYVVCKYADKKNLTSKKMTTTATCAHEICFVKIIASTLFIVHS